MSFKYGEEIYRPAFDKNGAAKISYGLRFPAACEKHIRETFNCSRVFVIGSATLLATSDALVRLKQALGDKIVGVQAGIKPHTPLDDCLEIIRSCRALSVDCLITLGAGSITDGAKLIRFALANDVETMEDFDTLWGGRRTHNPSKRQNIKESTMPLICIPTSLSGGEYQAIAGATEPTTHRKKGFEPAAMPNMVILDPELCTTTPMHVWLSTGVRSIDHCVETVCALKCDTFAAEQALIGLKRLVVGLLETRKDANALGARFDCQMGVIDAMCARSTGVPLGASHGIGHQLGPFGVGHGETSCIMLSAVCKYNAAKGANIEQQESVAKILRVEPRIAKALEARGLSTTEASLGDILATVVEELEMPRTLKDVGIGRDKLELLAQHSLDDPWLAANPFPITTVEQVLEILETVVE